MARFVVTGTDTEVGKSVVTACLAEAARATGHTVRAIKPIASGVPAGEWGEDASLLAEAGGHAPLVHDRFVAPVSPHRAAALERRSLDPRAIRRWIAQVGTVSDPAPDATLEDAQFVLIEGVGGWRVPLGPGQYPPELRDLLAPSDRVIVVAGDRLGVINHVRLTVEAVQRDGFEVVAVVLNRGVGDPEAPARSSNLDDLTLLLSIPVLTLDELDPADPAARAQAGQALWKALGVIR